MSSGICNACLPRVLRQSHLTWPLASVHDAVMLLSCCMFSDAMPSWFGWLVHQPGGNCGLAALSIAWPFLLLLWDCVLLCSLLCGATSMPATSPLIRAAWTVSNRQFVFGGSSTYVAALKYCQCMSSRAPTHTAHKTKKISRRPPRPHRLPRAGDAPREKVHASSGSRVFMLRCLCHRLPSGKKIFRCSTTEAKRQHQSTPSRMYAWCNLHEANRQTPQNVPLPSSANRRYREKCQGSWCMQLGPVRPNPKSLQDVPKPIALGENGTDDGGSSNQ